MSKTDQSTVFLALPKGHIQQGVFDLLSDAGIRVRTGARSYRPTISLPGFDAKILKPQNIVEMLHIGRRDLGFAGADWVAELGADLVEVFDTGLDPVSLVAAAPESMLENGKLKQSEQLVVASEYENLTRKWITETYPGARFIRSYGATEVFPPEDADVIVDNTATGSTLRANRLAILDTLMRSSTRLYAHPASLENPVKKEHIDKFVLLLESVLEARKRVMLEINVPRDKLEGLIEILPCLKRPTISQLYGEEGYAVKVAAPRKDLPTLIPEIKARGGSNILVIAADQIVQ